MHHLLLHNNTDNIKHLVFNTFLELMNTSDLKKIFSFNKSKDLEGLIRHLLPLAFFFKYSHGTDLTT